jgi:hypothetical protein
MGRELCDASTPVSDDYEGPFKFTGTLGKLTLKIDRPQLTAEDVEKLKEACDIGRHQRPTCGVGGDWSPVSGLMWGRR